MFMPGYQKGSTPAGERAHIREAFARCTAAIQAWPNATEAWQELRETTDLINDLRSEIADFRAYLAAYLADYHGLTVGELAAFMGTSSARASQLITRARKRGNPVTEPLTLPEQPHVALAIITSDQGVLVAKRRDGIPPWTFLGGEILRGETSGDALRRKVQAEAGLTVTAVRFIGAPHPPEDLPRDGLRARRGRPRRAALGDPDDLAEVRWASIDETRDAYAGHVRPGQAVPR